MLLHVLAYTHMLKDLCVFFSPIKMCIFYLIGREYILFLRYSVNIFQRNDAIQRMPLFPLVIVLLLVVLLLPPRTK